MKENFTKEQIEKNINAAPYKLVGIDEFGNPSVIAYGVYDDMVAIKNLTDPKSNPEIVKN